MVVKPNENVGLVHDQAIAASSLESAIDKGLLEVLARTRLVEGKELCVSYFLNSDNSCLDHQIIYHVLKKYRDAGWDVKADGNGRRVDYTFFYHRDSPEGGK